MSEWYGVLNTYSPRLNIRILDLGHVHEDRIPWLSREIVTMDGMFSMSVVVPHGYYEHRERGAAATMEVMSFRMRAHTPIYHQGAEIGRKIPKRELCGHVCLVVVYALVFSRGHIHQSMLSVR